MKKILLATAMVALTAGAAQATESLQERTQRLINEVANEATTDDRLRVIMRYGNGVAAQTAAIELRTRQGVDFGSSYNNGLSRGFDVVEVDNTEYDLTEYEAEVVEIIQEVYHEGYSDGYADGYKDGYQDGWRDRGNHRG